MISNQAIVAVQHLAHGYFKFDEYHSKNLCGGYMSKERELLERISIGETVWAPVDNSEDSLQRFDAEARDLMDTLDNLIHAGLIGNYRAHVESYTGKRLIDRLLITEGLTFQGQDKSQWPD